MPSTYPLISSPQNPLAQQFGEMVHAGQVLPGDGILYRYAHPDRMQRLISRIQTRALADLGEGDQPVAPTGNPAATPVRATGGSPWAPALFTHAGMVLDAGRSVEMTSPRCRVADWPNRLAGIVEIAVVRPVHAASSSLEQAAKAAFADAVQGIRYPYRELLLYWLWSWGWRKLRGRTPFVSVFRDRTRNVCSGSLIQWWRRAGVDLGLSGLDAWPEAWYPARLLADPRFRTVASLRAPVAPDVAAPEETPIPESSSGTHTWRFSVRLDSPSPISSARACPYPSVFVPPLSGPRPATSSLRQPPGIAPSEERQARSGVDEHGQPGHAPSPAPSVCCRFGG